jgi:vitamin-K-epoxide reductase (warfarin-sensitive)
VPITVSTKAKAVFGFISVFAAIGVVVSSLSLYHHFGTSKTSYCDIGENFNCDVVNRSIYSTVFGIPDALIGVLGYATLLSLATAYRARARTPAVLLAASLAGLGFALYLTYIEAFVLATWCILCLSSLIMITLIVACSAFLAILSRRQA